MDTCGCRSYEIPLPSKEQLVPPEIADQYLVPTASQEPSVGAKRPIEQATSSKARPITTKRVKRVGGASAETGSESKQSTPLEIDNDTSGEAIALSDVVTVDEANKDSHGERHGAMSRMYH